MHVLLVDNSKPAVGVHTPRLKEVLDELGCAVEACATTEEVAAALAPTRRTRWDAVILSGSSLNMSDTMRAAALSKDLMVLLQMQDVAVLGICFGMQLMAVANGGDVTRLAAPREGLRDVVCGAECVLGVPGTTQRGYFHHQDAVTTAPHGFVVDARGASDDAVVSFASARQHRFGVQFHPEASPPALGRKLLEQFLRVAQQGRVTLGHEVRVSRHVYVRVACLLGHAPPQEVGRWFGIPKEVVEEIWRTFRKQYGIPAVMW